MPDAPVLLRRRGALPPAEITSVVPVAVPMTNRLLVGEEVVAAAGAEKLSTSTLPIYTLLPAHKFKR
jgi:hypothetical protein